MARFTQACRRIYLDALNNTSVAKPTNLLVYLESHETLEQATLREKQIKKWNREWKLRLIESINPEWKDLKELLI